MPRNGSGTFNRLYDWTDDAAAGTPISSTRMDAEMDGMATALSDSISRDGQTTVTANLPMATYRHTGVGDATARDQYASVSKVQDGGHIYAATDTGSANAYAFAVAPVITAYAEGQVFVFQPANSSTALSATLNVCAVGAKSLTLVGGDPLNVGNVSQDIPCMVAYNATGDRFEVLNPANASRERLWFWAHFTVSGGAISSVLSSHNVSSVSYSSTGLYDVNINQDAQSANYAAGGCLMQSGTSAATLRLYNIRTDLVTVQSTASDGSTATDANGVAVWGITY